MPVTYRVYLLEEDLEPKKHLWNKTYYFTVRNSFLWLGYYSLLRKGPWVFMQMCPIRGNRYIGGTTLEHAFWL